jgi:predicted RNA binding protein YcfA (HicA-like mRNA interferase family)
MATGGKVWQAIKIVEADGWVKVKSNSGDHRQYIHPTKGGRVTIDGKRNDDLLVKTWRSIMRQAGLR